MRLPPALVEQWRQLSVKTIAAIQSRSVRERWLIAGVGVVVVTLLVQTIFVSPLQALTEEGRAQEEKLQGDLKRAERLAPQVKRVRDEIAVVETRIQPGAQTNLAQLLEQLAAEAQIRERLESVKPKRGSNNDRYPETRVDVQLRGVTLPQAVQYLFRIETAPLYLIVRSLSMKTQSGSALLDVSFTVSSFQRR